MLAKTLPLDREKTSVPSFNIIGSCADLFRFQADADEIIRIMGGSFGAKPICIMTSNTSVVDIEQMGGAHINLVIRREGEPAAKHLQKRFGTPYFLGRPYGIQGTAQWLKEISEVSGMLLDSPFVQDETKKAKEQIFPAMPIFNHATRSHPDEAMLSVGSHADVVKGIIHFAVNELSLNQGVCWCDSPEMADKDIPYFTEEQWMHALQSQGEGIVMASGEALEWAGRNMELQISNPDTKWRLSPYEPPFVGFRGAIHLSSLWLNALLDQGNN